MNHDTISFQAKAIVELLKRFKWNYVSFVHSDSEYGSTGYEMVKSVVKEGNENVCLADPITIYNNQFDDEDYKRVVETLIGKKNRTKSNNNEKSLLRPRVVIGRYISKHIIPNSFGNTSILLMNLQSLSTFLNYSMSRRSWATFGTQKNEKLSQTCFLRGVSFFWLP